MIQVTPGWKKGTKITFPSEGDEGTNIVPADLVFQLTEKPHPKLCREGNHLVYTARISLADALTDCALEVPTLDGRVLSIPCPEVVAPGYEKLIEGEGMPLSKRPGTRGDLIIRFHIVFPEYLPQNVKDNLKPLLTPKASECSVKVDSHLTVAPPPPKVEETKAET